MFPWSCVRMSKNSASSATGSSLSESPNDRPKLSAEARQEATELVSAFEQRLKTIAEQIAADAGSKKIVEPHIRQAYDALRRCGIDSRKQLPWYDKREAKITVGSFLAGLSPTIASVA